MSLNETEHRRRWVEASKRRAEQFDIVQFAWTEHHTYEVGSVADKNRVYPGRAPEDSPIFTVGIPHVRRAFAGLNKRLSLNGNMMRFKTHSLSRVDQLNIKYHDHEASNNGDYSRTTTRSGEEQFGLLHYDQKVNAYHSNFRLMPIMQAIRGHNDSTFGIALSQSDLADLKMTMKDGIFLVELRREKVWLDPARDYLPIRIERWKRKFDFIIDRIEIELAEHSEYGWLPSGWTYRLFDISGKLTRTFVTSGVKASKLATTKSDFELKFWPSIRVKQRRGDGTVWIATETGDLRLLNEGE